MRPNPLAIFVFLFSLIPAAFAWYAWRHRASRASQFFAFFMISMTVYIMGYSMELASLDLPTMLFWSKVGYLGIFSFPNLFLLFVVQYVGQEKWITPRNILFLFFIPGLFLIAKFTDDIFHLVYSSTWVDTTGFVPLLGFTPGPIYPFALFFALPAFLGIVLLWQKRQSTPSIYRKQSTLILICTILPLLLFLYYMSGIQLFANLKYLDINVFMYTLWGIGIAWAVIRYRLFELVPIARDKVFERLVDGVVVLDELSRLVDANPAALKILGLDHSAIGHFALKVLPPWQDLQDAVHAAQSVYPVKSEIQNIKDEDPVFYDLNITALQDEMGRNIGRLMVIHDITENKRAEKSLLKLTVFEERQRLARDLHDSVNQSIHGMVLFSETLVATLEKNNTLRARQIADRLQESARQSLKETRLMLYEMQPVDMDRATNLIQDLEIRLLTVERHAGVKAKINLEGSMDYCPRDWHENLFWISVEALNNALKHAQAGDIQINIRCTPHHLDLEIVDDGVGFDPEQPTFGGMGLGNMRERANLLGGNLTILSAHGKGSQVSFSADIK
jgi:PAS domain S-box-containing protein